VLFGWFAAFAALTQRRGLQIYVHPLLISASFSCMFFGNCHK